MSPNVFLQAQDEKAAKAAYNDWLELSYGYRDEGVGVHFVSPDTVIVPGNGAAQYGGNTPGNPEHLRNKTNAWRLPENARDSLDGMILSPGN